MTKNYGIGKVAVGLVAGATLGLLGGLNLNRPSDALPQRANPVHTQEQAHNNLEGQPFYEAVQRAEAERLSHPSSVENRLASKGIANLNVGLDIVSQLYRTAPELTSQLDRLTGYLTDNKQLWKGVGVYGLPSSAFGESDLDIDTGLKEWYGGKDRRQLWILDYNIDQAKKNPGTLGPEGLERLLKEQSLLRGRIFGHEEPLLTENDLQKMLDDQIMEQGYNDK